MFAALPHTVLVKVLLATCGAWYLPRTAKAFEARNALAGLWCSEKNRTSVSASLFRRCWPFHLAMVPFYFLTPEIWIERAFYIFFPLWKAWLKAQRWPACDVVQAIVGYTTEPFDYAEKIG